MLTLKTNNEYAFATFKGENEIRIENETLYGANQARMDLKIVDFNGLMVRNVGKMMAVGGDSVVFILYSTLGEIIVEYIMAVKSKFIVKRTSSGTLKYSFMDE